MKKQFKDIIHDYKLDAFKVSHSPEQIEDLTREIIHHTDEALTNHYKVHFNQDPDPKEIETYNMMRKFALETIMPPVVEKIMRRVVVLEHQHTELVRMLDRVLEALSEDERQRDARVG